MLWQLLIFSSESRLNWTQQFYNRITLFKNRKVSPSLALVPSNVLSDSPNALCVLCWGWKKFNRAVSGKNGGEATGVGSTPIYLLIHVGMEADAEGSL